MKACILCYHIFCRRVSSKLTEFTTTFGWFTTGFTVAIFIFVTQCIATGIPHCPPTTSWFCVKHWKKEFYKGYLTCNRVFDETTSVEPAEFGLNGVIPGWTEGIPLFKKGGKGKLLIPSALGYGPNGTFGIPGNTVLIFDIELISFF